MDYWNMLSFDMVKLEPNKTTYNFFETDGKNDSISIRDIPDENEVIKFAFTNQSVRDFVMSEFIEHDGRYTLCMNVQKPFIEDHTASKPGDLDILLIPHEYPAETIAIEVKYFKAVTLEKDFPSVNKVDKVLRTIDQVNNYKKFGFHKVFFAIILLDDARLESTPNQILRNTKDELIDKVYWEHSFEQISSDIGIVFIKLVQSLNKSHLLASNVQTKCKRPAIAVSQSLQTTEKIKRLLYENQK